MQITVKQMTSETKAFDVTDKTTGGELRKMISDAWHVPEDQQKLSYDGKLIEDGTSMSAAGLKEDAEDLTVNLFILSWTEVQGL
mmetsp:Transcript_67830/g.151934  ORF Transcript_67830/g.151934 Transcript_67830/m.151934 type:complete len:84 (-) Transcript_67830:286-537(-)